LDPERRAVMAEHAVVAAERFTTERAVASTVATYAELLGGENGRAQAMPPVLSAVHRLARSGLVGGRAYSALAGKAMARADGHLVNLPTGGAVVLDQDDWISRNVVLGFYERSELHVFRALVRPGDTVIDVGANIGFWTTNFAAWVGAQGRVLALEPSPRCLRALEWAVASNPAWNIAVAPVGAGARDAEGVLLGHTNLKHSGLGAVLEHGPADGTPVTVRSLASLMTEHGIGRCGLVKIDVEGLEAKVLEGLGGRLSDGSVASLALEISPEFGNSHAVAALLSEFGSRYALFMVGERGRVIRRPTLEPITIEAVRAAPKQFNLLAVEGSRVADLDRFVPRDGQRRSVER
jgi:FkbM family methyltransferase